MAAAALADEVFTGNALASGHILETAMARRVRRFVAACFLFAAADLHVRARVVVREPAELALPVHATIPDHCKDVISVGKDVWHAHFVTVCHAILIRATALLEAALIAALLPAAPIESSLLCHHLSFMCFTGTSERR